MIPRRSQLIGLIPPSTNSEEFVTDIQSTDDILNCVYDCVRTSEGCKYDPVQNGWFPVTENYCKNYAHLFLSGNTRKSDGSVIVSVDGVCADIWDFMQKQWPYDQDNFDTDGNNRASETKDRQTGRTVRNIIYTLNPKKFDCKHYSTFAFATLRAIGIPCTLRLTSYDIVLPSPSHIYVVAGVGAYNEAENKFEEEFIIDGTMPEYDQETKQGVTQYTRVKIVR